MILANYGTKVKSITSRNPQGNFILERVHQTLAYITHTFKEQDNVHNDENPWDESIHCVCTAWNSIHNNAGYHSIVFGWDSTLNTYDKVNWQLIKQHKQDFINKGNKQENCNWKEYTFNKRDKALFKNVWKIKFNQDTYLGPCTITAVRNNGTVRACKGKVIDTFNSHNTTPYKESMVFHYGGVWHTSVYTRTFSLEASLPRLKW